MRAAAADWDEPCRARRRWVGRAERRAWSTGTQASLRSRSASLLPRRRLVRARARGHFSRMSDSTLAAAALDDRYIIEREIGAGGMATVYLARDRKLDREVALKVLRPELGAVLGAERFLAEIRISARLDHPPILKLLDSGEAEIGRA